MYMLTWINGRESSGLNANGFKENVSDEYLSCFEYVYEKNCSV